MKKKLPFFLVLSAVAVLLRAQTYSEFEASSVSNGVTDVRAIRAAYDRHVFERDHVQVVSITPAQVVTSLVPLPVVQSAQQISLMLTNFTFILAQTGVDYAKLSAYAKAHAAELTGDQLSKLQAMDELWKDVSPYAPQGLVNFTPMTVMTNPATTNMVWEVRP